MRKSTEVVHVSTTDPECIIIDDAAAVCPVGTASDVAEPPRAQVSISLILASGAAVCPILLHTQQNNATAVREELISKLRNAAKTSETG